MNDEAALREFARDRRFRRWEDLLIVHGYRDEPVAALATAMQVATGKIKVPENWKFQARRPQEIEIRIRESELLGQASERISEELGAEADLDSFAERMDQEAVRIRAERIRQEIELRSREVAAEAGSKFAERIRQGLAAELQCVLDDALAGRPEAAKRFEQFADAARRVASGANAKERGINLETRALLAFERLSNGFREVPPQARVLAMVAEELGKSKLPKGTENKVRATIGPLYKP